MRVIRGKYGHRRFDVPKSFNARPTTDFAKENLFNILSNRLDFEGLTAADLFSGTGSIALELVSRGCASVTSVEKRREHAAFIRDLSRRLNEENTWRIMETDVFLFLQRNKDSRRFDFVFADPPYMLDRLDTLPDTIMESNILTEDGLFILEHPKDFDFSTHPRFVDHRAYGSVNFTFFR
ncbi:RsmD family RNA methyltransferase [Porphyromonas loveana]|uniref:RsmD family RNA methyltransferase n=1 Tax=Porphyromonas loveana TaxID=1884669 RepID=UPI0035A0D17F